MAGLDKETPILTSHHIKELYPDICQLMLVNNNANLSYLLRSEKEISESIERVFVWNGSTKVFLAMAKYLEDKINLEADTKLGDVRVILVVEDSVKYYSRYLPLLYTEIMSQTQAIIAEEPSNDEMGVILRMRVRPKLILVSNFDDAVGIINKYRNNIIGVISDVRYAHNGVKDEDAGVSLIKYVQQLDFIFRDRNGKVIDRAPNIKEFRQKLMTIPDESLEYHAIRNGISTWLMARAEINLAKKLRRYSFSYFKSPDEIRRFIANVFEASKLKKLRGRIIKFNPKLVNSNRYITLLGDGSLGGKGRGLAFLSNFIENVYLKKLIPDLHVAIPKTAVIGMNEFDNFLENNNLYDVIFEEQGIQSCFGSLPHGTPLRATAKQPAKVSPSYDQTAGRAFLRTFRGLAQPTVCRSVFHLPTPQQPPGHRTSARGCRERHQTRFCFHLLAGITGIFQCH